MLIRNREQGEKEKEEKKTNKGWLMLRNQEREGKRRREANLYTQGQHEVPGRRWGLQHCLTPSPNQARYLRYLNALR